MGYLKFEEYPLKTHKVKESYIGRTVIAYLILICSIMSTICEVYNYMQLGALYNQMVTIFSHANMAKIQQFSK